MASDNGDPVNDESVFGPWSMCYAEDPSTCDHGHRTLMDSDPVLGYLSEIIERHGIKRGGIQYGKPGD